MGTACRRFAGGETHRLPSRSAAVHWRASGDISMSSSMLMSDSVGPGEEEASLMAVAAAAPALGSAGAASGGGATLSRTSTAACAVCGAQRNRPAVGARRRAACGGSRMRHTPAPGTLAWSAAVGGGEAAASARALSQLWAGESACGACMRQPGCHGVAHDRLRMHVAAAHSGLRGSSKRGRAPPGLRGRRTGDP